MKQLARADRVTLGPRGRAVLLEKKWDAPIVSVDGVTVERVLGTLQEPIGGNKVVLPEPLAT